MELPKNGIAQKWNCPKMDIAQKLHSNLNFKSQKLELFGKTENRSF